MFVVSSKLKVKMCIMWCVVPLGSGAQQNRARATPKKIVPMRTWCTKTKYSFPNSLNRFARGL